MLPHTAMGRFRLAIPALSRGSSFSLDLADAAVKIFGSASASARVFIGLVAAAKGKKIFGQRFRAGPVHHGVCSSTVPALVGLRVGLFARILDLIGLRCGLVVRQLRVAPPSLGGSPSPCPEGHSHHLVVGLVGLGVGLLIGADLLFLIVVCKILQFSAPLCPSGLFYSIGGCSTVTLGPKGLF